MDAADVTLRIFETLVQVGLLAWLARSAQNAWTSHAKASLEKQQADFKKFLIDEQTFRDGLRKQMQESAEKESSRRRREAAEGLMTKVVEVEKACRRTSIKDSASYARELKRALDQVRILKEHVRLLQIVFSENDPLPQAAQRFQELVGMMILKNGAAHRRGLSAPLKNAIDKAEQFPLTNDMLAESLGEVSHLVKVCLGVDGESDDILMEVTRLADLMPSEPGFASEESNRRS